MIRSLSMRVLLGTTLTSTLVLALLGIGVDAAVRTALYAEFDQALVAKAKALDSMVEQHGKGIKFEFDVRDLPEFGKVSNPDYFQLWIDGKLFANSPSLGDRSLNVSIAPAIPGTAQALTLPDGRPGRVYVLSFAAHAEQDEPAHHTAAAVIAVARDTVALQANLSHIRWLIAGLSVAAILVSGAALLAVVRRAFRPVNVIARQIDSLDESALTAAFNFKEVPAELVPMVQKLDALLARLRQAFDRERAFAADVAHELRTPIAGLRATLEVCRTRPREPASYAEVIDKSLQMLNSMQTLVENLLLLARAESGQLPSAAEPTELIEILRDSWTPFAARAAAGALTIHWQLPPTEVIPCDPARLRIVVTNLYDNAVSYVDVGGTITVTLRPSPQQVIVEITNTGSHISPHDIPRLFERFWRKDEARSQTGLHAGLGLSLCQRLVANWGGSIDVASTTGKQFLVRFTIPRPSQVAPAEV